MYIRDIPPDILFRLYNMLDGTGVGQRNNWRQLAAYCGFTINDINSFARAQQRGGSPTEELLRVWDYSNVTVLKLFDTLAKMKHAQAMKLIKNFVDPKYHYKIDEIQGVPLGNSNPMQRYPQPLPESKGNMYLQPPQHQAPGGMIGPGMDGHHGYPYQPSQMHPQVPPYQAPVHTNQYGVHMPQNFPPVEANNRFPSSQSGPYGPYEANIPRQISDGHNVSPYVPHSDSYGDNVDRFPDKSFRSSGKGIFPGATGSPMMGTPPSPVNEGIMKKEQVQQWRREAAMNTTIHMDYRDIVSATENFAEKNKLGEGSFGAVFLATINQTKYAVKVLLQNDHVQVAVRNNQRSDQIKELVALANFRHKNIVLLCFFSIDGEHPCLIYEYLDNGSLEDNLLCKNGRPPLSWQLRHHIAEGAALGVNHLHKASKKSPLIHGDIKSANILLDKHFEPKIADFGLARPGPDSGRSHTFLKTQYAHGTLPYLPEEFHRNFLLSTRVDTFSFGVVLMEILTGERAFESKKENRLLVNYVPEVVENAANEASAIRQLKDKSCPDWPDNLFMEMLNLSLKCVVKYKNRPEMDKILSELKRINGLLDGSETSPRQQGHATQNTDPLASEEGRLKQSPKAESSISKFPAAAAETKKDERVTRVDGHQTMDEETKRKIEELHKQIDLIKMGQHQGGDASEREHRGPLMDAYQPQGDSPYKEKHQQFRDGVPSPQGPSMVGQPSGVPYPQKDLSRGWEEPNKQLPGAYNSMSSMPSQNGLERMSSVHQVPPSYHNQFPDSSTDSSNNPSSSYACRYFGGKESDMERAYHEGFQQGYKAAYDTIVQQMNPAVSMQARFPGHDSRLHSTPAASPLSSVGYTQAPGAPNLSTTQQLELKKLGYVSTQERDHPSTIPPGAGNKTDDAKITTSGNFKETNSQEKGVSDLETKLISLHELRRNKEPQQSTEPMEGKR